MLRTLGHQKCIYKRTDNNNTMSKRTWKCWENTALIQTCPTPLSFKTGSRSTKLVWIGISEHRPCEVWKHSNSLIWTQSCCTWYCQCMQQLHASLCFTRSKLTGKGQLSFSLIWCCCDLEKNTILKAGTGLNQSKWI